MTKREMFLLATSILFASTTLGLTLQGAFSPEYKHRFEGHKRPDMFAKSDTNKDGVVTKDEMLARQTERLNEFFTTVDTDKDGKLTREEMEKGRELMRARMKARFEAERATAKETTEAAPETTK